MTAATAWDVTPGTNGRDLARWFDPGWWRHLAYAYPDRLLVFGVLLALGLGFGGYASAAALGKGSADRSAVISTASGGGAAVQVVRTRVETRTLPSTQRVRLVRSKPVTVTHVVTEARTITVVKSRTRIRNQTRTVVRTRRGPTRTVVRTKRGPTRTVTVTIPGPVSTVTETVTVTTTCKHHC